MTTAGEMPIARREAGAGVDLRLVGDDAAADLLAGLHRSAGQLGLAAAGDLSVNVPATRYSRDEIAVVSGATGSCVSFSPTTSRCQPSGVSRTPGGPDGTAPSGGADWSHSPRDPRADGGSAWARGAPTTGIATQTDASMAKRFNMVVSAPLVVGIQRICNGSVAREPLMVGLPNGEHTKNSSGPVPIEWASCDMRFVRTTEKCNRPHRITKADGPQLDCGRWPVVHDLDI